MMFLQLQQPHNVLLMQEVKNVTSTLFKKQKMTFKFKFINIKVMLKYFLVQEMFLQAFQTQVMLNLLQKEHHIGQ